MIEATLLLALHATVVARLRGGESLAHPVPSTLDLLPLLRRERVVASQDDVRDACRALDLPLADQTYPPALRRA